MNELGTNYKIDRLSYGLNVIGYGILSIASN